MPENPDFELNLVTGRSMVRLRVRPRGAEAASEALQLPQQPQQWRDNDPAAYWLGPDQWLFTSDSQPAKDIVSHIENSLTDLLYAASDISSSNVCYALTGPAARTVLAMGCGIDLHRNVFVAGQCLHTHFANVLLFIVAVKDNDFDIYVDRSHAQYLSDWFADAGKDPITHKSQHHN